MPITGMITQILRAGGAGPETMTYTVEGFAPSYTRGNLFLTEVLFHSEEPMAIAPYFVEYKWEEPDHTLHTTALGPSVQTFSAKQVAAVTVAVEADRPSEANVTCQLIFWG